MRQSATQKKTLRMALPYWQKTPLISVRTKSFFSHRHYDVVIVGAGISGALVAEALVDNKRRIAIVDRREPVHGSSMASTAMIQYEIDVPLFKLQKLLKPGDAERIWLRSALAVKSLAFLSAQHQISCQMQRKKALYLSGDEFGARALRSEVEARNDIGLDAQYLDASDLRRKFQINRSGAIVSDISASANPAQLAAGILRNCRRQGVEIIHDTEISDFMSLNDKVVLATSSGSIISTTHVIFCTGYEFLKALARKDHQIISTWAIASRRKGSLSRPGFVIISYGKHLIPIFISGPRRTAGLLLAAKMKNRTTLFWMSRSLRAKA